MKNLILKYKGEEYIDSGVYERTLREEALKQGIIIDENELDMLLDELETEGNVEEHRDITAENILKDYLQFIN
jgi:hypothetical protein